MSKKKSKAKGKHYPKGREKRLGAGARIFNGKKFLHFAVAWTERTRKERREELKKQGYQVRTTRYKYGWDVWRRKG